MLLETRQSRKGRRELDAVVASGVFRPSSTSVAVARATNLATGGYEASFKLAAEFVDFANGSAVGRVIEDAASGPLGAPNIGILADPRDDFDIFRCCERVYVFVIRIDAIGDEGDPRDRQLSGKCMRTSGGN